MLREINSPKSRAILAAAGHLDALQVFWRSASSSSEPDIEKRIDALRNIARAHFAQSGKIDGWLTDLSGLLKLDYQERIDAEDAYFALIQNLDWDEGFETGYI